MTTFEAIQYIHDYKSKKNIFPVIALRMEVIRLLIKENKKIDISQLRKDITNLVDSNKIDWGYSINDKFYKIIDYVR